MTDKEKNLKTKGLAKGLRHRNQFREKKTGRGLRKFKANHAKHLALHFAHELVYWNPLWVQLIYTTQGIILVKSEANYGFCINDVYHL